MTKLKILVIDDEKSVRVLFSEILDEYASELIELDDGRFATAVIESRQPDLVITDVFMPDIDGLEIIPEIKDKYPNLPVYAISALSEFLEVASEMGADEVFKKPIDIDRLIERVQKL